MGNYIDVLVKKEKFEELKDAGFRDLFERLLVFFDGKSASIMNDVLEDWTTVWDGVLDYHGWLAYLDNVMFKLDIERQFYDYIVEEEKEQGEEGYIRSVGEVFEDAREMIWKYERLMLLKEAFEILKENLVILSSWKEDEKREYMQKGYKFLSDLVWSDEDGE